jgi:hypothetical protein
MSLLWFAWCRGVASVACTVRAGWLRGAIAPPLCPQSGAPGAIAPRHPGLGTRSRGTRPLSRGYAEPHGAEFIELIQILLRNHSQQLKKYCD